MVDSVAVAVVWVLVVVGLPHLADAGDPSGAPLELGSVPMRTWFNLGLLKLVLCLILKVCLLCRAPCLLPLAVSSLLLLFLSLSPHRYLRPSQFRFRFRRPSQQVQRLLRPTV